MTQKRPSWGYSQQAISSEDDQLMRRPWVENTVGLCERHLRTLEDRGKFPRRIKIDPDGHAIGWSKNEILAWIADRLESRNRYTQT